jgi:uncharacterized protein (TIGR00251 family)
MNDLMHCVSRDDRIGGVMGEEERARIVVQVQPNARQNQVLRFKDGVLHLRIAASPIRSRANQELVKFLSHILGTSKSKLIIEKGITSKRKVVGIDGATENQVTAQLARLGKQEEAITNG